MSEGEKEIEQPNKILEIIEEFLIFIKKFKKIRKRSKNFNTKTNA